MKLQLILLLAGCFVVAALAVEQKPEGENASVETTRANFVMPKLFDFQTYMEKFHKKYPNAAEVLRRTKLFMARAFAVFISGIKYMHNKSSIFLKIGPFSDWTQKERDSILNYEGNPPAEFADSQHDGPMPAVDPEELERQLAEIAAHKDENADYAAIAAELEKAQAEGKSRKRRNADAAGSERKLRKLTMEQLMGDDVEPESQKVPAKYATSVPSNNPHYEQPQMFSEAANEAAAGDQGEQMQPMDVDEAQRIDQQGSGADFLGSVIDSLRGAATFLLRPDIKSQTNLRIDDQHHDEEEGAKGDLSDQVFIDYRDTGCFLQAKSQAGCGSCYIFATISLLEYHHCRQTGKLVPFSEQYAVDCGHRTRNMNGCKGGFEYVTGEFVAKHGLELSVDYPYKAKEQTCPYGSSVRSAQMGHTRMDDVEIVNVDDARRLTPATIKYLLREKGPLYISVLLQPEFPDYGGGVDTKCNPDKRGGHAMTIVGYGREDGLEYWLIRNSHGIRFGLHGHYKLSTVLPRGCVTRVGYVRGVFQANKKHAGKTLFDEIRKKNLLAQFAQTPIANE